MEIAISAIRIPERQRAFDPATVEAIAGTLDQLGLKQPIEVSAEGDGYRLIAGRHRLAACDQAGWTKIPALLVALDDGNEDASAALHEAFENLIRGKLTAFDRMAHIAAAKAAHDALYPDTLKGRPKKMTPAAEEKLCVMHNFSFSRVAAARVGLDRSTVFRITACWAGLSVESKARLRGSRLANQQSELFALGRLTSVEQKLILDLLLATPPSAANVEEARARLAKEPQTAKEARKVQLYAVRLGMLSEEHRNLVFDANEDAVRAYAEKKGWLS